MKSVDSQAAAIRYAIERRGKGICVGCGTSEVANPELLTPRCRKCLDALQDTLALTREKHGAQYRKAARELRKQRKALGLCSCGSSCPNPLAVGRKQCQYHIDYNARALARHLQNKRLVKIED